MPLASEETSAREHEFGLRMARRSFFLKACAFPGCPVLTHCRFCPTHQRLYQHQRNERNRQRYGLRWQVIRLRVLKEEPFCRVCKAPTTEVDHIIPLSQGGTNARSNLQGLCKSCHSRKSSMSGERWGKVGVA